MITIVVTLIKTLLNILVLRDGPDSLPRERVVTVAVVALWLFVALIVLTTVDGYTVRKLAVDVALTAIGLVVYSLIINAAAKADRIRQALGAILGCGALLGLLLVIAETLLPNFLAAEQVQTLVMIIWLWSLPLEAHIIARTIDRQWYVGFVAALMVFFLQIFLLSSFSSLIDPVAPQGAQPVSAQQV